MQYVNFELEKLAEDEAKNAQAVCSKFSKPMPVLDKFCLECASTRPQNGKVIQLGEKLESLVAACASTFESQLLCLHVTDRLREM